MEKEEWRVVPGYPDYEVSNFGQVRRLTASRRSRAGIVLKQTLMKGKYFQVTLWKGGKCKGFRINRLVAMVFIGPAPSPKHEAAHNDGNSHNNHWTNLRWATKLENEADKLIHGTRSHGEKHGTAKLKAVQVLEIRRKYFEEGATQMALAAEFGVRQTQISRIVRKEEWPNLEAA